MTTQQRLPTGDSSTISQFTASGGSTKWDMVDDAIGSPDGDSTYIFRQNSNGTQRFTFSAFTVPVNAAVAKVTVYWNSKNQSGTVSNSPVIFNGTTQSQGSAVTQTSAYVAYSQDFLVNPLTGVAWTPAEVNALTEFGLAQAGTAATEEGRVTQCYIEVTYTVLIFSDTAPNAESLSVNASASVSEAAPNAESLSVSATGTIAEGAPASESISISVTDTITQAAPPSESLSVNATGTITQAAPPAETILLNAVNTIVEGAPPAEFFDVNVSAAITQVAPPAESFIVEKGLVISEDAPPAEYLAVNKELIIGEGAPPEEYIAVDKQIKIGESAPSAGTFSKRGYGVTVLSPTQEWEIGQMWNGAGSLNFGTNDRVDLDASCVGGNLTKLIDFVGTSKARIRCTGSVTLSANTTIPETVMLDIAPGCLISAGSARDLTIKGFIRSGPFKWVGTNITIKFVQADNAPNAALQYVFAEWWGAIGHDNVDDTAAFNAALNAMKTSRGVALFLLTKPYRASATVPAPTNETYPVCIFGTGDGSSIRTNSASLPALSLSLSAGEPNTTVLLHNFSLIGRGIQTAPVLNLAAQGGTDNRLFGSANDIKVVGSGNLADAVYIQGGLYFALNNLRTQEGRYALYCKDSSNTKIDLHAGVNTCNGIFINGGGGSTIVRARIEDSNTPNVRAISSISGDGTTVTVVTSIPHYMENMDRITINGFTAGAYNFTSPRSVTVVNSTTFTYAGTETGSTSGLGIITISASALRLKNTSNNTIYDFTNEGKVNLDYSLWLQSDGTTITGQPSCSHNTFCGGEYGAVSNTVRTDLSTVLIEGCCAGNRGYGATFGHSIVLNSNSYEFRFERNASNVRPRNNRFEGGLFSGGGSSYNFHFYEEIPGAFNNYTEVYERATERTYIAGNRRNINATDSIDENMCGTFIYTDGASSTVTISLTFDFFEGMKQITFINNSAQLLRIDPHGTDLIGTGASGKYLELAAGASAVIGCLISNKGDIFFSSGTFTYEP